MSGIFWDAPSEEDQVQSQPIIGSKSGTKYGSDSNAQQAKGKVESDQQEKQVVKEEPVKTESMGNSEGDDKETKTSSTVGNATTTTTTTTTTQTTEEPSIWTSLYDAFWGTSSSEGETVLQTGAESTTRTLATVRRPERKEGKKVKHVEKSEEEVRKEEILEKHSKAHEQGETEGKEGELLYFNYTVQPGDTLQGVALRHKVTVSDLARSNGLFGGSPMITKETLVIPLPPDHPNYQLSFDAQRRDVLQKRFLKEKPDASVEEAHKFLKRAEYDFEEAIELFEQAEVNSLTKISRTGSGSGIVTTTTTTTNKSNGNGSENGLSASPGSIGNNANDLGVTSSPVLKGVDVKLKSSDDFFEL